MIKGQVVSGEFEKIVARVKSGEKLEIGELVVIDSSEGKSLLQVYDLVYGSQISPQNLEMVSGMELEEGNFQLMDSELRNYNLAYLKPMLAIAEGQCRLCKSLPNFFSRVREITARDLDFITMPTHPFHVGRLRSGSKEMDVDIFLPGDKVFCEHVGIFSSTGKGKSLDEDEEVLIKQNNLFSIKSIGEIVNNSNFRDSTVEVVSMNPKNYSIDFKKITNFVRHKAPSFMYQVKTESGREVMVTADHNLYILRNGHLVLLKTQEISEKDYLPLPLKIDVRGNQKEINLFELLRDEDKIYVLYSESILKKLKLKKECLKILSKYFKSPLQKYNDFVVKRNKIRITLLTELLKVKLSSEELESIELTDKYQSLKLKAIYPLTRDFLQLLGYYTAEGYCLNDNSFRISCSEKIVQKHLEYLFRKIGLNYFWIKKKDKNVDVGLSSSIFTKLLRKIGIGRISGEKRLPSFFMNLSDENLRILLKTYFEGDGSVDREKIITRKNFNISTTTKSKKLASDICFALYKYGIFCRCKKLWKRSTNSNHDGDWYYRIKISGKTDLIKFLSEIGFQFSRKNNILRGKFDYKENTNVDLIPCSLEMIKKIRLSLRLSQKELSKLCNCSGSIISAVELGKRRPSRNLATKVVKMFRRQLSSLDYALCEKLVVFSDSSDYHTLVELINKLRNEQGLTLLKLGKRSGIYMNQPEHHIKTDLKRILVTKKVENSPKIYQLGKVLLSNSKDKNLFKTGAVFKFNFREWSEIVRKTLFTLNFPNHAMQKERQELGKYARKLKKGKLVSPESLKQLAKLLVEYHSRMREAEPLIKEVEKLLNFRWDRIKEIKKISYDKKYVYDLTVKDNKTFLAGHGGLFVHNSNLMSCILWDVLDKDFCGMLVLDPHDEYYGRAGLGLKDHFRREKLIYYSTNPVVGGRTLKVNLKDLKPEHFQGAVSLSDPQRQCLYIYYRQFKEDWIKCLFKEEKIGQVSFHEDTIAVVKRKLISLLGLEFEEEQMYCRGVFDDVAGENTVAEICGELEEGKVVILDTSYFSGAIEILVGSLIAGEIFEKYKYAKREGRLREKPVVSIVLEEAPRVLGKKVLEQGSNVFETIAREGRKFKIGLCAITQIPSEIPKNILANMNTKIILGLEMGLERQAVIESSPQDLSKDGRTIASLDKGEAIVTSIFTKFAVPVKIPLFEEFAKKENSSVEREFSGIES